MQSTLKIGLWIGVIVALFGVQHLLDTTAEARRAFRYEVDPFWPKLPAKFALGQVGGVAVDALDHIWVLQRPWSLETDEQARNPEAECCTAAPPVMEFNANGDYLQGWGGPGEGYEWPADEHGINIDPKGNVWVTSAGGPRLRERTENQILKFTAAGKFLLQVGHRGKSKGSLDTENFNNAADIDFYAKTNEAFVADGYVNRRVIVIDMDTGKFKRMWGAYGKPPDDAAPNAPQYDGPAAQQFNTVHGIHVSDDGLVYVADRLNNRMQVFTIDGQFQREIFIERKTRLLGTAFSVATSPDPRQQLLYIADAGNGRIHVLDRESLREVGSFGRIGRYAGQFVFLHKIAVDSKGNVYTAEVGTGRRAQKFVRR